MIREKSKKNLQAYIIHFQQLPSQGQSCFIHTIILFHSQIFQIASKKQDSKKSITQYQN